MTRSVSQDICNLVDGEAAHWLNTVENWHCVAESVTHEKAALNLKMQLGCETRTSIMEKPGSSGNCPDQATAKSRAEQFARASETGERADQRERLMALIRSEPLGVTMEPLGEDEASWTDTCGPCHGNGQVNCHGCRGSGAQGCSSCGGHGDERCVSCNGQGFREDWDFYEHKYKRTSCSSCFGRGSESCSSCHGSGTTTCGSCGGSGQTVCSSCVGLGKITHLIIVTAYSSVRRVFALLSDDLSGWVKDYVLGGEKTRAGAMAPLPKIARWELSDLVFSEQAGYPIKAEMPGELDAVTAVIRPDTRFSKRPVETHFVGSKLQAIELGGILDTTLQKLLEDDPGPEVRDSKLTKRWLNSGVSEKLLEMKSPEEFSELVMGKLQLFTQTVINQLDERVCSLKDHVTRQRSTLGIGRMVRGTMVGMLVFYLLFVLLDTYAPGHIPWNKLGFDAAVRFFPLQFQALLEGDSNFVEMTIITLGVAIVVIGLWTFLFAQPRRRKFGHFAFRVVLMTLLVPPFLFVNERVLKYHDNYGLLPQSHESVKYYADHWGVPAMAAYDPKQEAQAAAIGVLWALPDIFVMASLLALLRERRRKDKQGKTQLVLLENPTLLKQLDY